MTPQSDNRNSAALTLPRDKRLRKTREFQRCFAAWRAGDGHLLLFAAKNEDEAVRLGVSVSKKHGNAVARNRRKRLLREAWRTSQHELPTGFDYVMVPRQHSDSSLQDYQKSVRELAQKILRKHRKSKDDC